MNPQIDTQLYNRLAQTGAFGEKPQLPTATVPTPSSTASPTSSNVVITPESLQTEPSLVIPPPVNSTTAQNKFAASVGAGVGVIEKNQTEQAEMDKIKAQNPREENLKGVQKLLADIGLKGQRTQEVQEEFAVTEKRKAAKNLENEILSFDREWKERIEAQRKASGGRLAGTNDTIAAMERDYNSQRADKLIAYKILNDDYQGAKLDAQAAIDAEFEPLENELNSRFQLFNVLNNDLSEKEQIEFKSQLDRENEELESFKSTKKEYADIAVQSGNPNAVQRIRNAKDEDEVLQIAAEENLESLESKLKNEQLLTERAKRQEILDNNGKIDDKTIKSISTTTGQINNALNSVNILIKKIEDNDGFESAVGAGFKKSFLSILPGVSDKASAGTKRADFEREVSRLKGALTLPALEQMKGLGAMSEIEFNTVASSVASLDVSMSEKAFKEEVERISTTLTMSKARNQAQVDATKGISSVPVISPNNEAGVIPESQLEEALVEGYIVIE